MKEVDVAVVGAGPAGLAASVETARRGCRVLVMDMNPSPGGQLIKQVHKFFGAKEHRASRRGLDIADDLYREATEAGVAIWCDAMVYSLHEGNVLGVARGPLVSLGSGQAAAGCGARAETVAATRVVLATGAAENPLQFEGWTLPGVVGAGAAQTMINVWRVLPGRRVLMVGSGNVGLIVSYQLLQAGAEVVAVVEAAPRVGGYAVHAAKISRAGVPVLTSHTVIRALGETEVRGAVIARVDESWEPVPGTEQELRVDTVCVAAGLRPYARLAALAGCRFMHCAALGGWVPVHNARMESSVPGIYVAGDVTGVEEASTSLEEGRLAGLCAASDLGRVHPNDAEEVEEISQRLSSLRAGPFGGLRQQAKLEIVKAGETLCRRG